MRGCSTNVKDAICLAIERLPFTGKTAPLIESFCALSTPLSEHLTTKGFSNAPECISNTIHMVRLGEYDKVLA
jgi:hypothetical protein